jgi:hypothetical protein
MRAGTQPTMDDWRSRPVGGSQLEQAAARWSPSVCHGDVHARQAGEGSTQATRGRGVKHANGPKHVTYSANQGCGEREGLGER